MIVLVFVATRGTEPARVHEAACRNAVDTGTDRVKVAERALSALMVRCDVAISASVQGTIRNAPVTATVVLIVLARVSCKAMVHGTRRAAPVSAIVLSTDRVSSSIAAREASAFLVCVERSA